MNDVIEISDPTKLPANPLVSVHMLAYKHEKYLADAIEGVLLQRTDFPIELVIAEDHSPDGTLEVAKRYQREHPELIRILTSAHNVGMMANFQRAMRACRGTYIAICEGDDYFTAYNKLQLQAERLDADSSISLVHSAWDDRITRHGVDYVSNNKYRNKQWVVNHDALHRICANELFIMTCTVMMRADVIINYLETIDTSKFAVGDWPMFAFAASVGRLECINLSTSVYRHSIGSAMRSGYSIDLERTRNAILIHQTIKNAIPGAYDYNYDINTSITKDLYKLASYNRDLALLKECRNILSDTNYKINCIQYCMDVCGSKYVILRWPLQICLSFRRRLMFKMRFHRLVQPTLNG